MAWHVTQHVAQRRRLPRPYRGRAPRTTIARIKRERKGGRPRQLRGDASALDDDGDMDAAASHPAGGVECALPSCLNCENGGLLFDVDKAKKRAQLGRLRAKRAKSAAAKTNPDAPTGAAPESAEWTQVYNKWDTITREDALQEEEARQQKDLDTLNKREVMQCGGHDKSAERAVYVGRRLPLPLLPAAPA